MVTGRALLILCLMKGFYGAQVNAQTLPAVKMNRGQRPNLDSYHSRLAFIKAADSINCKFYFLKGLGNKISGNTEAAIENFNECLKYDPTNDAAYYELALARVNSQNFAEALLYVNKALSLKPDQIWYLNLLATIYDQKEDFPRLAQVYRHMSALEPDKVNYYLAQANALANAGEYETAIGVLNRAEKVSPSREEMEFQKQKIFLKTGRPERALESMQRLIAENPSEPRYYLLLAQIYQAQNDSVGNYRALKKAISIDSNNGFAQLALSDYYRQRGAKKETFQALKNAFNSEDVDLAQKKQLLNDNYVGNQSSDQHEGLELARLIVRNNPDDAQAQAIYAGFLVHIPENTREGRDAVIKVLEQNKENFGLWASLIVSDLTLRDYLSASTHSTQALSYFPNQSVLYWYQGLSFNQLKNFKRAVVSLKAGLVLANGQTEIEASLFQTLGEAYQGAGDYQRSEQAYEESLKLRPNDAGTLNNYAYYLCMRKKDLSEAAVMAQKALAIEPDNSNYEDTLAWILYKEGKFSQALGWIRKAIAHDSAVNATLRVHQGDILYKMGKTDQAVENWKKAKAFGSKDLNLDKKIANKKIYE